MAQQHPQLATVLVFVPASNCHRFEVSLVEQGNQPVACLDAEVVLVVALRLRDLRRVDVRDPDLRAFEPDCVAVDDAGASDHAADRKAVRGSRFGALRPKWPINANQASKNASKETASYKKGEASSSAALAPVTSGPELDNIIAGWSLGHSAFFHFRTVRPRHRARFLDDFRLVSLQREGAA